MVGTQNEPLHRLGKTLVIARVCGSVGLLFLVLAANGRSEQNELDGAEMWQTMTARESRQGPSGSGHPGKS
jgi:hypothetical protein